MLAQMRSLAKSFVAKILLGLLIIAFAIWGIQGVFSGIRDDNVVTVGGRNITAEELKKEFNLALDGQRQEFERRQALGQPTPPVPTRQQMIEQNAHMQVLEGLIQREAMQGFALGLGLQTADSEVSAAIRQIPAVQNEQNQFEQARYDAFLRQIGYSHAGFVEMMRGNVAVQQLMLALTSGARAPRSYGALLLAYQSETRIVSVAQLTINQLGAIPEPTDAQVQSVYAELRSAPQMQVPQYRNLTLIVADPNVFAERVDVPEAEMRTEFERRAASLGTPERRSFSIVTTQTEAQARTAAQRLARGDEAAAVAREMNAQAVTYDTQAESELPDATLARAVFALPANATPQVVRGSLAPFAAVRLIDVTAGVAARFEDFREQIRTALAGDRANEEREHAIEQFSDAVGEGTAPAEAARAAGLQVVNIPAIDERGLTPAGAPVEGVPLTPALIAAAFQGDEGDDTDFIPIADGVEVFTHITGVTPATVRSLDAVRAFVIEEWKHRERERRLEAAGDAIIAAVRNGQTLAAAAAANHATMTARSQRIDRTAAERTLPQIFAARVGEPVKAVSGDARMLLVAQVEQIDRENAADHTEELELMRQTFERPDMPVSMIRSLAQAVQTAAVAAGNPRRNQALIDQTFPTTRPDDAQR